MLGPLSDKLNFCPPHPASFPSPLLPPFLNPPSAFQMGKSVFFCSVRFLLSTPFVTHAAGRAKKTLRARFFVRNAAGPAKKTLARFFCSRRGWPNKKNTRGQPGRVFFVRHAAGPAIKHSGAAGALFFCSARGWPSKKKNTRGRPGRAFLLFGTRLAQQNEKHSGAGGARFFFVRHAAGPAKRKTLGAAGARFFFVRDAAGPAKKITRGRPGRDFLCSGRGWPSKKTLGGGRGASFFKGVEIF